MKPTNVHPEPEYFFMESTVNPGNFLYVAEDLGNNVNRYELTNTWLNAAVFNKKGCHDLKTQYPDLLVLAVSVEEIVKNN